MEAPLTCALCANLGEPHCLRLAAALTTLAFWSEIPSSLFWPFLCWDNFVQHTINISSPSLLDEAPGFTAIVQIEIAVDLWILDQTE